MLIKLFIMRNSVNLDAPLTQIVHSGQEISLGDITSFKWDKVGNSASYITQKPMKKQGRPVRRP